MRYNSVFFRVCFFILITLTLILMQFSLTLAGAMTWLIFVTVISLYHLRTYCRTLTIPFFLLPYFWILSSLIFISIISSMFIVAYDIRLHYMFERYAWQNNFSDAIILSSLAVISVSFGTSISSSHSKNHVRYSYIISPYRATSTAFLAITLYLYWVSTQGGLSNVLTTRTGLRLNGIQRNVGYLVDSPMILVSVFVCFYIYSEIRHFKLLVRMAFLSLITISLIPYILSGGRSYFIYVFLVCFIAKNIIRYTEKINIPKVRPIYVLILTLILPAILVAPRIYRTENSVNLESLKKAYSIKEISQTVIGGDGIMIPTLSILISEIGNKVAPLHGSSYLNLITKPIPRVLWKNKPVEFDMYLNNSLFPETSRYYGVSFSAISEPLTNFGVLGVAVFFTLIGYLYDLLVHRRFELNLRSIIIASWLTGFCFILVRGNLTTDYHRVVFPLVISLLLTKRDGAKLV